ncbi:MAG: hypothetical protein ACUVS5_14755 [Anaerolineae bacterium]
MTDRKGYGLPTPTWSEEEDRMRRSNVQLPPGWAVSRGNPRMRRTIRAGDYYTHILMPRSILVAEAPVGEGSMRARVVEPGEGHLTKGQSYIFSVNLMVPISKSTAHTTRRADKDKETA